MAAFERSLLLLAAAATLCACDSSQPTGGEPTPSYSAAQFYETTGYGLTPPGGITFSPDGNDILMSSDATGVLNAYALPVSGDEAVQLTDSTDNAMFGVSWFPHDRRILFTYDSGGNELNHVVVRELDGSYHDLTPGDDFRASFLGWSDDGESFYLLSTERNQQSFDVYRYSADDYSREMVFSTLR